MPQLSGLLEPPLFAWLALAMGLAVGSFANVCIHRLPRHQSVVFPPSACPTCSARIPAHDNIPVLGWLKLGGWCPSCHTPISVRYPLIEGLNGVLYWFLAATRGASAATFVAMGLATALVVLSLVDLEHHLLPDAVTLPGIVVGCIASLLRQPPGPLEAASSAAGGYLGMAAIARAAEWYYGEEALGQGDWKMIAMLGAFLGARPTLTALFLATAAGAALGIAMMAVGRGTRRMRLPLGTFLGMGGLAVLLAGDALQAWYDRFFLFVLHA
jgi:leader peptidase (prepilin peptidase) / N-methyltransferase